MSQVWGIISVPYADVSLGTQNRGSTPKCLSPLGRKSFWLSSSDCKIYEDEETLLKIRLAKVQGRKGRCQE